MNERLFTLIHMINFIIYEEDKHYIDLYVSLIHKFMAVNNDSYKIYKYSKYSSKIVSEIKNLVGYNIYIFDIEVHGKSGLDLAKEIRNVTDYFYNQIILVTSHTDLIVNAYHNKLLMFDFLSKFDDLETNLMDCFQQVYFLFNRNKNFLSIKADGELIRIPHNDIVYIEKSKNDNFIYIHTDNNEYKYKSNISDIECHLQRDVRFLRSHRSAIVNINKITHVDMTNNIIYFKSKKTNYLARDRKKDLERQIEIVSKFI